MLTSNKTDPVIYKTQYVNKVYIGLTTNTAALLNCPMYMLYLPND